MTTFALVDCNNFYVSCERAFKPALNHQPVIVLSNNDGCVISRSLEAKKLGIPMGAPFFKWEEFCRNNGVHVFSSNYELYGDMSQRVMHLLKSFCPDMEIYSIDESFLILDGERSDLFAFTLTIKEKIKKWTGIPVSIGFAQTKTLAKIANHLAKYDANGVFDLRDLNRQSELLNLFPVRQVWGIGSQLAEHLKKLEIHTAKALRDSNEKLLRARFSVTLERTIQELRGISCIPFEKIQPRQQIISSRSFGKNVTELEELEEAVSYYAAIAARKLRKQNCVAKALYVFLQTNIFNKSKKQYGNCLMYPFPVATADTRYIIRMAKKSVGHIYRSGFKYHKAGVMLIDIQPNQVKQYDLITHRDSEKTNKLMKTIDQINQQLGQKTIFYCAEGILQSWQTKSEKLSARYTTRWNELVRVKLSN